MRVCKVENLYTVWKQDRQIYKFLPLLHITITCRIIAQTLDGCKLCWPQKIIRNRIGKAEVKTCDRRKKIEARGWGSRRGWKNEESRVRISRDKNLRLFKNRYIYISLSSMFSFISSQLDWLKRLILIFNRLEVAFKFFSSFYFNNSLFEIEV